MKKFFNMRRLKYGSNSIILTISVIGIIILLNIFLTGYNVRFDMTKNNLHTLSDKTKQVLEDLDQEVQILGFFKGDSQLLPQIYELTQEYGHKSDKIKISLMNINANPIKARNSGVTDYGTVVIKSGDKSIMIRRNDFHEVDFRTTQSVFAGEERITQGIIDVTTEKQNKAYFIEGHGELSDDSLYWFKNAVKGEGYKVSNLNIAEKNGIPEDADLLVIAAPSKDFNSDELWFLSQYTANGGRVLFLMRQVQNQGAIDGLRSYMSSIGVKVNNDVVIDPVNNYFNDPITIIPEYEIHTIVNKLDQAGLNVVMPGSLSLEMNPNVKGKFNYEELLVTGEESWGETNITAEDVDLDENDNKGPVTIAAAITKPGSKKDMKVVVIGNAAMATNELINEQGNMDFLINAINFTQDKENLISIRSKNRVMEPLTIKGNQGSFLYGILVGLIPLLIFITGLIISIRRRRR